MSGPRAPKSERRQSVKTVDGVRLVALRQLAWRVEGTAFVFEFDEHARSWVVGRSDGRPCWYGGQEAVAIGVLEPVLVRTSLVGTLKRGVDLLRELGWVLSDRPYTWGITADQLPFCGPHRFKSEAVS